ncbi:MAG: DNA recombination protein RmuC [Methylococcaceae bacterium]|nr:MAG: DNA recombination protein RmuC [Methylococcaceae bacterium]
MESHNADLQNRLAIETAARARAEQQCQLIPPLERRLSAKEAEYQALTETLYAARGAQAEMQARVEEERKATEEKLALLRNAEAQLVSQFENLAGKILEEKSQKFTEQNRLQLDGVLLPFREQISEFRKKVDDMHLHDAKDRASLRQEIQSLSSQTQIINQEAANLARALKGDRKAQGNWGEMILEKVLEQSGLRKGIEYDTQGSFRDADNRLLRPDVVVHLPEGKDIVVDSKVSLSAYERYANLDDGPEREQALSEHVLAVRNHVKSLRDKDYAELTGLRSLDFVLMFMPIEAAFVTAFQHDEKLFSDAFSANIVVVTPTTLLATLRTIGNIWRYERQNENARLIADKAAKLYDKLRGFTEDMEKLGNQLATSHKTYEDAMNKLTTGKGNVIRQAAGFAELGVKIAKPLPKSITERAGLEELPEDGVAED